MINRIHHDDYGILLAKLVALRGTCPRRRVGCVLVDDRRRVLATGYNGAPRGIPHCGQEGSTCYGASLPSGSGLEVCQAIHAEQNALLQCTDPDRVHAAYVTVAPCSTCAKLLLNTGMKRLIAGEGYAHDTVSLPLLAQRGVEVVIYKVQDHNRLNDVLRGLVQCS